MTVRGTMQQICTVDKREECGYSSSDDSGEKWEALFAIAKHDGCFFEEDSFKGDGDGELQFCVGGWREEARGCA